MKDHIRPALLVFAALAASPLTPPIAAQAQWPTFQADAAHTGYVPITIDPSTTQLRWSIRLDGGRLSQVTSGGGKAYVSSSDNNLYALDSSTGKLSWTKGYGGVFSVNPPAWAAGRVYLQTCNNAGGTFLWGYDDRDGSQLFRSPFGAQWERYKAPTVVEGTLYMNGGTFGGMYAFDAVTGSEEWFAALPQEDDWTPAVDATHAYVYAGSALYAIDRATGGQAYTIADPNGGFSRGLTPVLGGNADAYVVSNSRLVRFDLANRSIAWEWNSRFSGQPAIRGGEVYAISAGDLEVRDRATGQFAWLWSHPTGSLSGTVVVTDSHAIVGTSNSVHFIDRTTHQEAWTYAEGGEISVTQEGLFIARQDGILTAIEFGPRPSFASLAPAYTHYARPMPLVTIDGSAFSRGGPVVVEFGGEPATNVTVIDDQTLTCVPPPLDSGVVDVAVRTKFGQGVIPAGFAYVPALRSVGLPLLGKRMQIIHYCEPADQIVSIIGVPPRAQLSLPPFTGVLEILPPTVWVVVPSWPFPQLVVDLDIPADRSLRGAQLLFQGLIGKGSTSAFSNTVEFTVQ